MTSERWQRIEELYHAASELPPAERPALLETRCAGDQTLRAEVEALLRAEEAGDRFDDAIGGMAREALAALRPGDTLGRFTILELIGMGGMGRVFAAHDAELGRRVAIKVMNRGATRILGEAKALAALSHPNVVTVYDVGARGEDVFIAMELVDGVTLREWLDDAPRTPDEVLAVFRQAAEGLAAAHRAGIIHRDFKPENVLLGRDGRVRVSDFGLAHELAADDAAPLSGGTPAYMSPEQLDGRPLDARTDLYSFCVALYEALYRERPFPGKTTTEVRAAIAQGAPREPRKRHWLHPLLLRGLSALPERRLASIEELFAALARDPRRRRRRLLLAAAGLAAVGAAVTIALVVRDASRTCTGAAQRIESTWGTVRKTKARAAFLASGRPRAAELFDEVSRTLDAYKSEWIAMHERACEATRVTHEQPEDVLKLRMACLWRRRWELGTLTRVLATADAAVVDTALDAARNLESLRGCADPAALTEPVPLPEDRKVRARIQKVRLQLARLRALALAGKAAEAEPQVTKVIRRIRKIGYAPLRAEAWFLLGQLRELAGNFATAAQAMRQAAYAAAEGRANTLLVRAWIALVWIVGVEQGRVARAGETLRNARGVIAGLGGDTEAEAELTVARSMVLVDIGRYQDAEKYLRQVLEKRGAEHPRVAQLYTGLGAALAGRRRFEEAIAFSERGLDAHRRAHGDRHPHYAHALAKHAETLAQARRLEPARRAAEGARQTLVAVLGAEHAYVAAADAALGAVALAEGRYLEARELLERTATLLERTRGPEHTQVARVRWRLGQTLSRSGRRAEALLELRRAREIFAKRRSAVLVARLEGAIGAELVATGARTEAREVLERALPTLAAREEVDDEGRGHARFALARALGGPDARARELARAARQDFEKAGATALVAEVDGWLRARRR